MSTFLQEISRIWYLTPCILGVFTIIQLLLMRTGSKPLKQLLMLLVGLLIVPAVNGYIYATGHEHIFFLTLLAHNLAWCYGPIILFLVRHLTLHDWKIPSITWHFAPFLLCLFLEANPWVKVPMLFVLTCLTAQISSYFFMSVALLVQHKKKISSLVTGYKNSGYYWALYLAVSLGAVLGYDLSIHFLAASGHMPAASWINFLASLLVVYICSLALFCVYQPALVFEHNTEREVEDDSLLTEEKKVSMRYVELSFDAAAELKNRLEALAEEYKIYLDDDLSLAKLAAMLGISQHQLSELLNVHMETSFYDYLNNLRHVESIKLLENPNEKLSIQDIAYRSGFNNRNSFYKVFKKHTGLTPKEYQQKIARG